MASSCAGPRGEPSCRQERKGQLCSGSFKSPQPRDTRSLTVTSWLLRHAVLAVLCFVDHMARMQVCSRTDTHTQTSLQNVFSHAQVPALS